MRNWLVGLVAAVFVGSPAAVFADQKVTFDQGVDAKAAIQDIKEAVGDNSASGAFQLKGTREWTVMVYVNAKNNLESFGLKDLNEMEMVGSNDKVAVVAELGRIKGYSSDDGDWTGSRRYLVQKDADAGKITSPVLQNTAKADMGDWKHLVEFVNWAKGVAPAKHYMLVIWNHGSGWDRIKAGGDFWTTGISYDDETGNHISTDQLGQAVGAIGGVDILSMDACLMQMAEVAYQVKGNAEVVVASEETEPGDGYTYNTMLEGMNAKPAADAVAMGKVAVKAYTDHYAGINQGATQSAVRPAALAGIMGKLDAWTGLVMQAKETALLKTVMSSVQDFYYSDNKDLVHFVKLMVAGTKDAEVKAKGDELVKLLTSEVITYNQAAGSSYANALGLAVYLPSYSVSSNYAKLAWAKDGNWDDFAKFVSDAVK